LRVFKNFLFLITLFFLIGFFCVLITKKILYTDNNIAFNKIDLKKIELVNYNGNKIKAIDLFKKPAIFYFGFTSCPDICPLTLTKIYLSLEELEKSEIIDIYFISLDPERDTPDILKNYLATFNDKVIGVTGNNKNIKGLTKSMKIKFNKRITENTYTIDHTSASLLVFNNKIFGRILFDDDLENSKKKISEFLNFIY